MTKDVKYVPEGIKYISQWGDYQLPTGKCIVDKSICGCGYTEYCISKTNPDHVILCSPRIALLDGKFKKHKKDPGLFYYSSELLKKDFETDYKSRGGSVSPRSKSFDIDAYNKEKFRFTANLLRKHYDNCVMMGQPCKILVTYDSFHSVKNILTSGSEGLGILQNFKVVVDEFQSIFLDAFYKSKTENVFSRDLSDVPNVIYLSATPMLQEYLEQIEEFQEMPYQKIEWPESRITTAKITERWVSDPYSEILDVIDMYKDPKRFAERPVKKVNGLPVFPTEAVIYVNSVSMIKNIITRAKLTPDECNIVCSKTNKKSRRDVESIRRGALTAGQKFTVGEIPEEGEPNKMFTFCTSAVYLGADFYSNSAMTYIVSDANVQSLVVDIRLDLPQILGRQRWESNPWKNDCIIFYKTLSDGKQITKEDFEKNLVKKQDYSMGIIRDFPTSTPGTRDAVSKSISCGYQEGVGQINYYLYLDESGNPVYDPFLQLAEIRAWELCQYNYKNNISVIASISDLENVDVQRYEPEYEKEAQKAIEYIESFKRFDDKLEKYCEFREANKDNARLTNRVLVYFRGRREENYYSYFGIDKCRAHRFRSNELSALFNNDLQVDSLRKALYSTFSLKKWYSLKDIKTTLGQIYNSLGITATPKAKDLLGYFNVIEKQVTDKVTKKRVPGYELISIK